MTNPREKLILLVEDDDADVELTRRAFEQLGFHARLENAVDGLHALERLRTLPRPDLILTDIKMPRMNGLELQERLREEPGFKDVPVVFLTSSAERGDRDRALAGGAKAFLQKPMELAQYQTVFNVLRPLLERT